MTLGGSKSILIFKVLLQNLCRMLKKMKIAIIRTDLIGDFLLWLESAKIVRNEYPDAHITLICNNIYVELAQK